MTAWTGDVADTWEDAEGNPPRDDCADVVREGMPRGGAVVRDRLDADAYIYMAEPVDVHR